MNQPDPAPNGWLSRLGALVMVLASGASAQNPPAAPPTLPPAGLTQPTVSAALPAVPPTPPTAPPTQPETPASPPTAAMEPGAYLDVIGQQVKARWRQMYRETPPALQPNRLRVAFTLGGLMAESYLAVQAGDGQRFRNNNQEIQKFCGVLGLTDKISPDINAGSKMAESEDWPALRKQVEQMQQHIESSLNEQRDEDLAILSDLGMWIRLMDIGSSLVVGAPELVDKSICIGSVPMLNDLVGRFEHLSEVSRTNESVAYVGGVLEMLQRHWTAAQGEATDDIVQMTHDKLKFVIGKVEAK